MKTTTKKRIGIVAVSSLGLVSIVLLSSFIAFKGSGLNRPFQSEELIEYAKNNILPTLKEKRENFDLYLNNEEKQKVAELQQRLSDLHAERNEYFWQRPGYGRYRGESRPEITDEQREQFQAHMKERRLIMTEAWAIADTHEIEIESILS